MRTFSLLWLWIWFHAQFLSPTPAWLSWCCLKSILGGFGCEALKLQKALCLICSHLAKRQQSCKNNCSQLSSNLKLNAVWSILFPDQILFCIVTTLWGYSVDNPSTRAMNPLKKKNFSFALGMSQTWPLFCLELSSLLSSSSSSSSSLFVPYLMKEQQASEKVPLLKLQASQPTHKALLLWQPQLPIAS